MDYADPHTTYRYLLDLGTSGVRNYHSLLSVWSVTQLIG